MSYSKVREGITVLFKLYINFSLRDFEQLSNFHLSCASSFHLLPLTIRKLLVYLIVNMPL